MRYFIIILVLLNFIAIHNVLARKYDNDDDDQPIARRRNERLKQSEDNNLQRRQRSDLSSKNNKFSTKSDLETDKKRIYKKYDNEKESNKKVFITREEKRPEPKRGSDRGDTRKYNRREEKRSPKVTDTRKRKEVKAPQGRQPNLRQTARKQTKHIPDDTDEDDDDTDENDDDDDDDTDEDDDDETDEDDVTDQDGDTDEDDDDTDEDDDDNDDDNTDEDNDDTDEDDDDTDEDDDSFEMIAYKDKKKPTFFQRLQGKKNEKPKKQLSYRKKVYRELGLVDDDMKNASSEEIIVRPKKYSKKVRDCDSMEEYCP